MTARYYDFTLNNYTNEEVENINSIIPDDLINYIGYGKEVGSGTPHLQGLVVLSTPQRFSKLHKYAGFARASFRKVRALGALQKYIEKEGDFFEFGVRPKGQGQRTDLEDVVAMIDKPEREIAEECPVTYIKFFKGIRELKRIRAPFRNWEMEVFIVYGDPGTGKTRFANEFGDVYFLPPPGADKKLWFDLYNGEETIVIDDFYGWIKWSIFMQLLDRYKCLQPHKGGFYSIISRRIVLTSNAAPWSWYKYDTAKCWGALTRRVTRCIELRWSDGIGSEVVRREVDLSKPFSSYV